MSAPLTSTTPAALPYSPALPAHGFVFLSGQVGLRDGQLQNASFVSEVEQVMANVERLLQEQQLTLANVVSVTVYLTDMGRFTEFNALYAGYFQGQFPTRTCIGVVALPLGARVEVTAIAQLPAQ